MRIGEYQDLIVNRDSPHGLYLGDVEAEILLPKSQCPRGIRFGDTLRVFVYTDSEDRPIATLKHPYGVVGEFAKLRAVSVTSNGAFLDWGLDKDLFCPVREQQFPIREGYDYLVRIYLDELSKRVSCTTKISKYLRSQGDDLQVGQPIKIMVANRGPEVIGVIIDGYIKGSLFRDEWHERLEIGDVRDAFVKSIRPEDKKVAVSLRPQGYQAVLGERERLLKALRDNQGTLPVSDKSSPEEIHRRFGLSKSAFKKLIGTLYKEGQIEIESHYIRLKE
jgi:uncharacterized protein